MIDGFEKYLFQKGNIKRHQTPYFVKWVRDCLAFLHISDSTFISSDLKKQFLTQKSKNHEDWQVNQADTALRLYNYFLSHKHDIPVPSDGAVEDWDLIEEKLIEALRLRHRSLSTEKTYKIWVRSFRHFLKQKVPSGLEGKDLQELLGHSNLQTTMIYTHVASRNVLGVRSPLDR